MESELEEGPIWSGALRPKAEKAGFSWKTIKRARKELDVIIEQIRTGKAPLLGDYIETYLRHRRSELAPGTWQLHEQTSRYLKAYFGASRRLDSIQRTDARAFKAALAAGELQEKAGGHKNILSK